MCGNQAVDSWLPDDSIQSRCTSLECQAGATVAWAGDYLQGTLERKARVHLALPPRPTKPPSPFPRPRRPADSALHPCQGEADRAARRAEASPSSRGHLSGRTTLEPACDTAYKESGVNWWEYACPRPLVRLGRQVELTVGFPFKSEGFRIANGVRLLRGVNVAPGRLRWEASCIGHHPILKSSGDTDCKRAI